MTLVGKAEKGIVFRGPFLIQFSAFNWCTDFGCVCVKAQLEELSELGT